MFWYNITLIQCCCDVVLLHVCMFWYNITLQLTQCYCDVTLMCHIVTDGSRCQSFNFIWSKWRGTRSHRFAKAIGGALECRKSEDGIKYCCHIVLIESQYTLIWSKWHGKWEVVIYTKWSVTFFAEFSHYILCWSMMPLWAILFFSK